MKTWILAVGMVATLGACADNRHTIAPATVEMPPIGLAAQAVWLEERGGAAPRVTRAADIPTSQIRSTISGARTPPPVAQPVPDRAAPSGTIALAAQAFADACVASLPNMAGVAQRLEAVSLRDFGVSPDEAGRGYFLTGQQPGNIFMTVALGVGRHNVKQCSISVRRQDPAVTAQTLVNTVTNAGYSLTPVAAGNAAQAWAISGAPAGTTLKTTSRRNALGQQLTGVWITWQ